MNSAVLGPLKKDHGSRTHHLYARYPWCSRMFGNCIIDLYEFRTPTLGMHKCTFTPGLDNHDYTGVLHVGRFAWGFLSYAISLIFKNRFFQDGPL